jgi:hypothetical protein
MPMTPTLPVNWLRATIDAAREEIATWPAWKKAELAAETHQGARR